MSDDTKKPNEVEKKPCEAENQPNAELSKEDLAKVTGGALTLQGIEGESTKSGAEGWIEIFSYDQPKNI